MQQNSCLLTICHLGFGNIILTFPKSSAYWYGATASKIDNQNQTDEISILSSEVFQDGVFTIGANFTSPDGEYDPIEARVYVDNVFSIYVTRRS